MMRAVFAICIVCLVAAVYSGYRIVSETHLYPSDDPSPVPGVAASLHRDSIGTLEQAQRIRASQLAITRGRPVSRIATILDVLSGD